MSSPGGQTSGMTGHQRGLGRAGVDKVGHPADLPPGLPRDDPGGRATRGSPPVASRAAPGPPRDRATPGRRDTPRLPARKIIRSRQPAERHHDLHHAATHGPARDNTMTKTGKGITTEPHHTRQRRSRSTPGPLLGRRTSGSIEKLWRSSQSIPPGQYPCLPRPPQVAKCGADELACKPDPVHRAPCGVPAGGHPSRPAGAGRL